WVPPADPPIAPEEARRRTVALPSSIRSRAAKKRNVLRITGASRSRGQIAGATNSRNAPRASTPLGLALTAFAPHQAPNQPRTGDERHARRLGNRVGSQDGGEIERCPLRGERGVQQKGVA